MKSVRIRRFSGPYSPAFGLNTERYSVSLRIKSECGKIRTRKTPNTDNFHALCIGYEDTFRKLQPNHVKDRNHSQMKLTENTLFQSFQMKP